MGILAAVIFVAMSLAACGGAPPPATPDQRRAVSELLIPEGECRAAGPRRVSRAEALADLERLEQLFERGYAGYEAVAAERWSEASRSVRAGLPDSMTPRALRDRIARAYRFLDDNHVGFWIFDPERDWVSTGSHARPFAGAPLTRDGDGFRDEGGRALAGCEPSLASVVRPLQTGATLELVPVIVAEEPPPPIRCGAVELALEPLGELPVSRGPAFEREGGEVVLRSLMTTQADGLERFVAAAEALRREPLVRLDVHGTGGGADRYLVRFFGAFAGTRIDYWTTGALTSETTLQGAANFWRCVRASSTDAGSAGRAWLDDRIARAEQDLDQAAPRAPFRELRHERMHVPVRAPRPFAGRLIVVTGPGCASACETTVLLARQIPGTWIVGQNTSGTMKVGELRWYRLEESAVWVALGRREHRAPGGGFEEGRGFVPDVWIDGSDFEGALERLSGCATDPPCAARVDAARAREPSPGP